MHPHHTGRAAPGISRARALTAATNGTDAYSSTRTRAICLGVPLTAVNSSPRASASAAAATLVTAHLAP